MMPQSENGILKAPPDELDSGSESRRSRKGMEQIEAVIRHLGRGTVPREHEWLLRPSNEARCSGA